MNESYFKSYLSVTYGKDTKISFDLTNHYCDHFATKHTNLSLGLMYTIENLYCV